MEFFKRYYNDLEFNKEQVRVACPFHKDDNPSASINTDNSLFYCPVCGEGYNEIGFVAKLNNISFVEASKVISKLDNTTNSDWGIVEKAELWGDAEFINVVRNYVSDDLISKLDLGMTTYKDSKFLGIPIYYNGVIMDVKSYNILGDKNFPKMISQKGSENGYIFPYDLWKKDNRKTYILEGEKDAMVAREFGLNGITITGGATAKPNNMVISAFKDKEVVIMYDNDDAGREGMNNLYLNLRDVAKSVKYIDISDVVKENKEDFTDAVHKYHMDYFLFELLPEQEFSSSLKQDSTSYTTLKDAFGNNSIGKNLRSIVNVNAEYSDMFALPIVVEIEKVSRIGNDASNAIDVGSKFTWYFDAEKRLKQLYELIEYQARSEDVINTIKKFMNIPSKEKGLKVSIKAMETVYKYKVMDANSRLVISDDEDGINNTVIDLYSFDKMDIGVEYDIDYVIYPHTFKNQKLMGIARHVEELNIGRNFVIEKDKLDKFKMEGSVKDRVNKLYQSAKHQIAKHLNYEMWLMSDLTMNSILEIDYGGKTWGALDVFILGDTATGKSEVTKGLVDLYDFGHFLSLKTATTVGLIGGSKKEGDSLINTIGAIPRQHKKLVVMEEFSGANPAFIKTMTDIRTTRRVHIIRVSGELNAACNLRMITISNPLGDERGLPKYLTTFPNGVVPLMELINNPEDVGRYDGFILMPQITTRVNPFTQVLKGEKIDKEYYEYKAKWVYTREAENVIFDEGVEAYIWDKAEELNNHFESNFPLFGTKSSIKLARFSVALASLIINTDESYENIIVTKEIVDFIMEYFYSIYDNNLFKLHSYKKDYDSYNVVSDEDILELQELYPKNSNILDYLDGTSVTSLENLKANSGLDLREFNVLYTKLSQMKLIRSSGRSIMPTTKLRKALPKIDKSFTTGAGLATTKVNKTYIIEEENNEEGFDGI